MAHTTVNSGFFIGGTHVLTPFDGSFNHGHQFRSVVAPEEVETEEVPDTSDDTPVPDRVRNRNRGRKGL